MLEEAIEPRLPKQDARQRFVHRHNLLPLVIGLDEVVLANERATDILELFRSCVRKKVTASRTGAWGLFVLSQQRKLCTQENTGELIVSLQFLFSRPVLQESHWFEPAVVEANSKILEVKAVMTDSILGWPFFVFRVTNLRVKASVKCILRTDINTITSFRFDAFEGVL